MTVNKVLLVGNLGKDAELRNTNGGMQIASLRLATTDRRKGADGAWQDHTEWHSVVCFDKLAALMERFGKKGKQLYVEGRIQTREYTDKEGQKRWSTEVVANDIRLLGGREADDGGRTETRFNAAPQRSAPAQDRTQRAPAKPAADDGWGDAGDDGLPF
jgi:single-strand DNA-binding protein